MFITILNIRTTFPPSAWLIENKNAKKVCTHLVDDSNNDGKLGPPTWKSKTQNKSKRAPKCLAETITWRRTGDETTLPTRLCPSNKGLTRTLLTRVCAKDLFIKDVTLWCGVVECVLVNVFHHQVLSSRLSYLPVSSYLITKVNNK